MEELHAKTTKLKHLELDTVGIYNDDLLQNRDVVSHKEDLRVFLVNKSAEEQEGELCNSIRNWLSYWTQIRSNSGVAPGLN